MARQSRKLKPSSPPQPGWTVCLCTSSDENQKPKLSRARQRFAIQANVLERSELPVIGEYVDLVKRRIVKVTCACLLRTSR